jgi:hypothetical protein
MNAWLDLPGFEEAVAHVVENVGRPADDGFLDADAAAEYLGLTRKALYHVVERRGLPHHHASGYRCGLEAALDVLREIDPAADNGPRKIDRLNQCTSTKRGTGDYGEETP